MDNRTVDYSGPWPIPANPMLPHPCRILAVRRDTRDVFTLDLDATGALERPFRPGQFNMLYVFGVGEVPISISGDPLDPKRIVHTTREVGTVTRALGKLKKGASVGLRGPYGTPWPVERAAGRDVLLIAGGIGLAPLRPIVYEILARRKDFGRVWLLYGTRSPEDILYRPELAHWSAEARIEVQVTVNSATAPWPGNVGVVTTLLNRAMFDPASAVAFICGPESMLRFCAVNLINRGLPPGQILVSMERNMKCAIGFCGHCQYGPEFVCKDGPVFEYARVQGLLAVREL